MLNNFLLKIRLSAHCTLHVAHCTAHYTLLLLIVCKLCIKTFEYDIESLPWFVGRQFCQSDIIISRTIKGKSGDVREPQWRLDGTDVGASRHDKSSKRADWKPSYQRGGNYWTFYPQVVTKHSSNDLLTVHTYHCPLVVNNSSPSSSHVFPQMVP